MQRRVTPRQLLRHGIDGFTYRGDTSSSTPVLAFRDGNDLHMYRVQLLGIEKDGTCTVLSYDILEHETERFSERSVRRRLKLRSAEPGMSACYMEESTPSTQSPENKLAVTLLGYLYCGLHAEIRKSLNQAT